MYFCYFCDFNTLFIVIFCVRPLKPIEANQIIYDNKISKHVIQIKQIQKLAVHDAYVT